MEEKGADIERRDENRYNRKTKKNSGTWKNMYARTGVKIGFMAKFANIIIDISYEKLDKTFQYMIPEKLQDSLQVGMLVQVPFGNSKTGRKGYVVELTDEPEYDLSKMKQIQAVEQTAIPIESELVALAAWIRENYGGTMHQALRTVLPIKQKNAKKEKRILKLLAKPEEAVIQIEEWERKHYVAKVRLLRALLEDGELPYEVVTQKLHSTASTVRSLEEAGLLKTVYEAADWRNPIDHLKQEKKQILLNTMQQQVVDTILLQWDQGIRKTYLLHGVTGSGKTEVYMELIAAAMEEGKQSIVLIPEIALTFQTVMRFHNRFGDQVSILHSKMSPGERYDQYERAKRGEIQVMIGPRSALFTPFSNLGFIIIDEEHETSYKSETVPRYHAREVAIQRAKRNGASVVLGSATPSIESYYHAKNGDYELLELKQRVEEKPLPTCEIIDLREELRRGNRSILSDRLQELMEDRLKKGQQMMLFLNRRGMSGFVSCRACGQVIKCPHCDVSLSLHNNGKLKCHYCGYETQMVKNCPSCGSKYIGGFKAGTQKIEEIVKKRFPMARTLRMDFDTTRNKDSYEQILSSFSNQEADILIGTQMIVKGHDFPNVTLVGVLAADMSLYVSDFHATERTFQLLTQAAGRAGRGKELGNVVIQTYNPDNTSIQHAAAQDYETFYQEEILYRRLLRYPPVWHMLSILVASKDEQIAQNGALYIKRLLLAAGAEEKQIVGPADAVVAKVNDIYKKVIYIKHEEYDILVQVKNYLEKHMDQMEESKHFILRFDFDPMNGF